MVSLEIMPQTKEHRTNQPSSIEEALVPVPTITVPSAEMAAALIKRQPEMSTPASVNRSWIDRIPVEAFQTKAISTLAASRELPTITVPSPDVAYAALKVPPSVPISVMTPSAQRKA